MSANVIIADEPIKKPGPMRGLKTKYWTKEGGITLFVFDHDNWAGSDYNMVPALPGMVGTDYRGESLWLVLENLEVVKLDHIVLASPMSSDRAVKHIWFTPLEGERTYLHMQSWSYDFDAGKPDVTYGPEPSQLCGCEDEEVVEHAG